MGAPAGSTGIESAGWIAAALPARMGTWGHVKTAGVLAWIWGAIGAKTGTPLPGSLYPRRSGGSERGFPPWCEAAPGAFVVSGSTPVRPVARKHRMAGTCWKDSKCVPIRMPAGFFLGVL